MMVLGGIPQPNPNSWKRFLTPQYLILIACTIISIRAWSYALAPERILWMFIEKGTMGLLIAAYFMLPKAKTAGQSTMYFKPYITTLTIFSFTTYIPLLLYNGQNILSCINNTPFFFYWLIYYALHRFQIKKEDVLLIVIFVGVVWASITIIQQFTYPHFLFYSRYDYDTDDPIEFRAGIYRFMVDGHIYGITGALYALNKYLCDRRKALLPIFFLGVVGIYYHGTRQYMALMAIGIVAVIVRYLYHRGKRLEIRHLVAGIITFALLLTFQDKLFGKLIEMTKGETHKDNVRVVASNFFLFDYWPHSINFIFGNGTPRYLSPEGQRIRVLMSKGLYQSDVGVIGTLSIYGILFTVIAVFLLLRAPFLKTKIENVYLQATFVYTAASLGLSEMFANGAGFIMFLVLIFYLYECYELPGPATKPAPAPQTS